MKNNIKEKITIRELTSHETSLLLEDKRFAKLKPDNCSQCEEKNSFRRRIFEIIGVAKNKQNDDETQNFIQYHFKHHHSIDFIFFKIHKERLFVDTALCEKCKSTTILYDIDLLDQDLISETSKITGKSEAQIKNDLKNVYEILNRIKA